MCKPATLAVHDNQPSRYVAITSPYRTTATASATEFSQKTPFLFLAMAQVDTDNDQAFLAQVIPELTLNEGLQSLIAAWDGPGGNTVCQGYKTCKRSGQILDFIFVGFNEGR